MTFSTKVKRVLAQKLRANGIYPKIVSTAIPGTRFRRFVVVSPKFGRMGYSERQGIVWRIVQEAFDPDERVRISVIHTLTPTEYKAATRKTTEGRDR